MTDAEKMERWRTNNEIREPLIARIWEIRASRPEESLEDAFKRMLREEVASNRRMRGQDPDGFLVEDMVTKLFDFFDSPPPRDWASFTPEEQKAITADLQQAMEKRRNRG